MGLHLHHDIPEFDLAGRRALIITTSQATLGEGGNATGVFTSEMTVPYYAFLDAGMEVDIASIDGGAIPVELNSMGWPLGTPADYRFKADTVAMAKIANSIPVARGRHVEIRHDLPFGRLGRGLRLRAVVKAGRNS